MRWLFNSLRGVGGGGRGVAVKSNTSSSRLSSFDVFFLEVSSFWEDDDVDDTALKDSQGGRVCLSSSQR